MSVPYQPGEWTSGLFGGNSNWRGPIWFPVNFLIVESLQKLHHYCGDEFKVECPTDFEMIRTLKIICTFMSTSMAIQDAALERHIKPAGLDSLRKLIQPRALTHIHSIRE